MVNEARVEGMPCDTCDIYVACDEDTVEGCKDFRATTASNIEGSAKPSDATDIRPDDGATREEVNNNSLENLTKGGK